MVANEGRIDKVQDRNKNLPMYYIKNNVSRELFTNSKCKCVKLIWKILDSQIGSERENAVYIHTCIHCKNHLKWN